MMIWVALAVLAVGIVGAGIFGVGYLNNIDRGTHYQ